jgi:hypothetical protein
MFYWASIPPPVPCLVSLPFHRFDFSYSFNFFIPSLLSFCAIFIFLSFTFLTLHSISLLLSFFFTSFVLRQIFSLLSTLISLFSFCSCPVFLFLLFLLLSLLFYTLISLNSRSSPSPFNYFFSRLHSLLSRTPLPPLLPCSTFSWRLRWTTELSIFIFVFARGPLLDSIWAIWFQFCFGNFRSYRYVRFMLICIYHLLVRACSTSFLSFVAFFPQWRSPECSWAVTLAVMV